MRQCAYKRVTLVLQRDCVLKGLPCAAEWDAMSDLLPEGFTYKPITLGVGLQVEPEDYRWLKKLKSARYLSEGVGGDLIRGLKEGTVCLSPSGIYLYTPGEAVPQEKMGLLPEEGDPYGNFWAAGSRFHLYLRREDPRRQFQLGDAEWRVAEETEVSAALSPCFVLQADLPVTAETKIAPGSGSRFRILLREGQRLIAAGSVIDRSDWVGEAMDGVKER